MKERAPCTTQQYPGRSREPTTGHYEQSAIGSGRWRKTALSHQVNFSASFGGNTKAKTHKESSRKGGTEQNRLRKSDPSRNRTRAYSGKSHPEAQPRSTHREVHETNPLARAWKIDYNYRRTDRRRKGVKPPADSRYHTERMKQQGKTTGSVRTGTPTNHPVHDHEYGPRT